MFKLKVKGSNKNEISERLDIQKSKDYTYVVTNDKDCIEESKINIVFSENHLDEVDDLLDKIMRGNPYYVYGYCRLGEARLESDEILYFQTVETEVYAVTKKQNYLVKEKLYQLEEELVRKPFVRVSKSVIVNLSRIKFINPLLNYKLELEMENGTKIEVNRSYMKQFKKALK